MKQSLNDTIEYVKQPNGKYTLHTCDPDAARAIGARFDPTTQTYVAANKKAPSGKPYVKKFATAEQLSAIRKAYEKLTDLHEELRKAQLEVESQETRIINMLLSFGVNLKIGKPRDRQLLVSDEERLHHCQAVIKWLDTEAAKRLVDKYPALQACFVTITSVKLDRAVLRSVLPDLPPLVSRQIEKFETVESLKLIPLAKPQCPQCGGRIKKDGSCLRCGFVGMPESARVIKKASKKVKRPAPKKAGSK